MSARGIPRVEPLFDAIVEVGSVESLQTMAMGERRVIAITGGTVNPAPGAGAAGGLFRGRVLAVGEDWQWARSDDILELSAHYVLELDSGERIEVSAEGFRHGPADVLARIAAGEPVEPDEYYFRTSVRMRTSASNPAIARLNGLVIVCAAERRARQVCLSYYAVV
ncbi:MAG: DUF3237 family protein [Burkholderiaceae bacterium]|nr:DUF3237 family protein [Burkholderiaceae bacterium]